MLWWSEQKRRHACISRGVSCSSNFCSKQASLGITVVKYGSMSLMDSKWRAVSSFLRFNSLGVATMVQSVLNKSVYIFPYEYYLLFWLCCVCYWWCCVKNCEPDFYLWFADLRFDVVSHYEEFLIRPEVIMCCWRDLMAKWVAIHWSTVKIELGIAKCFRQCFPALAFA